MDNKIELSTLILTDSKWEVGPSANQIRTKLAAGAIEPIRFASKIIPTQESFLAILYAIEVMGKALMEFHEARVAALKKRLVADDGIFFQTAKLNYAFSSMLVTTRGYIDRTRAEILRLEGNDANAEKYRKFCQYISKIYDSDWRYRVADKLRNFSEHYDLPMSSANLNFSTRAPEGLQIDPYLTTERMLSTGFNWGSKVRSDLEGCKGGIFIVPLLGYYAKMAQTSHNYFFKLYESEFVTHEKWIREIQEQCPLRKQEYLVYIMDDPSTGKRPIKLFPFVEFKTVRDCQKTINELPFFDQLESMEVKVPADYESRFPIIPKG